MMNHKIIKAALVAMYPDGTTRSTIENGRVIVSPQMFDHAERVARAVIEALREPTPAIIAAGESAMFEWREKPEDWTLKMFADGWRNAIDEVLGTTDGALK